MHWWNFVFLKYRTTNYILKRESTYKHTIIWTGRILISDGMCFLLKRAILRTAPSALSKSANRRM
jgi:hypothetical protein